MTSPSRSRWLSLLEERLREGQSSLVSGRVVSVRGGVVEARLPGAVVGQFCEVEAVGQVVRAEVVGVDGEATVRLLPWGSASGVGVGSRVIAQPPVRGIPHPSEVLGRVLNGVGEALDGGAPIACSAVPKPAGFVRSSIGAASRLETGVGMLDALAPLARGARVAVVGEAGAGKSSLLRTVRRRVQAEVVVIGLVGERAREAAALVEEIGSGPEAARTTVVVASSEAPASERVAAAELAAALAAGWRSEGRSCLLLVDSLTRYARALREVAQLRGESLGSSGYPVTMGGRLAQLLEQAGAGEAGAVTGLYTVLSVAGEPDPVVEEVRSLVDTQWILRRQLADRGVFPALDPVASMSRLSDLVLHAGQLRIARLCRGALGALEAHRDALELGYYRAGTRPALDAAVANEERLLRALREAQGEALWSALGRVAAELEG